MFNVNDNTVEADVVIQADVKNIINRSVIDGKLITCVMIKDVETISADVYEVDQDGNSTYCAGIEFKTLEELDAEFDKAVESARELFGKTTHSGIH